MKKMWNEALCRLREGEDLMEVADENGFDPEKLLRGSHTEGHPRAHKKHTLADLVFWRVRKELRASETCGIARSVDSPDYIIIPEVSIPRFLSDPLNVPRYVMTVTRETTKEQIAEEIA
jgi:hypothetical protein